MPSTLLYGRKVRTLPLIINSIFHIMVKFWQLNQTSMTCFIYNLLVCNVQCRFKNVSILHKLTESLLWIVLCFHKVYTKFSSFNNLVTRKIYRYTTKSMTGRRFNKDFPKYIMSVSFVSLINEFMVEMHIATEVSEWNKFYQNVIILPNLLDLHYPFYINIKT